MTDFTAREQLDEHLQRGHDRDRALAEAGEQFRRGGVHVEGSDPPPQRPVQDTADISSYVDDPEISAMIAVEAAIVSLTRAARSRVLRWALDRNGYRADPPGARA